MCRITPILECRACDAPASFPDSERGGPEWADACALDAQDWGEHGPLLRCPSCGVLGRARLRWSPDEASAAQAVPVGEAEYLAALEAGRYRGREEKLCLRLYAWRQGNEAMRARERAEGRAQIRSAEAQANLEALFDLLCEDTSAELICKAEVARHLGEFSETARLLALLPRRHRAGGRARAIQAAAAQGDSGFVPVAAARACLASFTCRECQRRGRAQLGQGPYADSAPGWLDPQNPAQVVACGRCGAANWVGEGLRARRWLEDLPASAGCAGVLVLIPALCFASIEPSLARWLTLLSLGLCGLALVSDRLLEFWAPSARPCGLEQLYALLDQAAWEVPQEERWLRTRVLLSDPAPSPRAEANRRALGELLGDRPDDRVLLAELLRREGREAEAAQLAAQVSAELAEQAERDPLSGFFGEGPVYRARRLGEALRGAGAPKRVTGGRC